MRIRSIKPEFWRSPDISCLAIEDRLLFIGLWSYVDDNGVGEDRVSIVAADLFADDLERDPSDTFARVSRGLANLAAAGRVIRYTVDGRDYLEVANWSKHQRIDRPGKERMPKSDHKSAHIREGVAKARETPLTGTGEQGNRGTGEQRTSSSANADAPPADAGGKGRTPEPHREDVEALCERLREHIERNTDKPPTVTQQWRTAARLLLDRDRIEFDEAMRVLDWSQQDSFWQSNILSMPKFRKQFAQLQMKSRQQQRQQQQRKPQRTWVDVARGMSQQNNYVDATVIEQGELE